MYDDLQQKLEVLFDAIESGHRDTNSLRRSFIRAFCQYFDVIEGWLVSKGKELTLSDLGYSRDREFGISDLRQQATSSLERNIPRLKPGQPGVHEDVRMNECAYVYKRIMHSVENAQKLASGPPQHHIGEAGPSNWTAAFTHPDPLDPNDAQRQRTQRRAGDFPYDSPVSYGAPVGTDTQGDAHQKAPDQTPPVPRNKRPEDEIPYGQYGTAWEQLESLNWGIKNDPLDRNAFSVFLDELEQVRDTESKPVASPEQVSLIDGYLQALAMELGSEIHGSSRGIYTVYTNPNKKTLLHTRQTLEGNLDWFSKPNLRAELQAQLDQKNETYWTVPKLIADKIDSFRRVLVDYAVLVRGAGHQFESRLGTYSPGPQADDALSLGYGNHGRMGEDGMDPEELDMDMLRQDFKQSFLDTLPRAQRLGSKGLFALLVQLDPEYSAELFAPDDDSEMCDLYNGWGEHVYAPGAEEDPE